MKHIRLSALAIFALALPAAADPVTVTPIDDNGSGGVYEIGSQNYWWMCIEPDVNTTISSTITADLVGFLEGWDQQNTGRLNFYQTNPGYYTTVIPKQVSVMEYVLDTYLPWNTLAGPSGRFAEQNSDASQYANNDPFYNPYFAVQNFLSETYGKTVKEDFTDMSDFSDYNASNPSAAGVARSGIFQSILSDVAAKDSANFFDTYSAQHTYLIVNTLFPANDPSNYQDAIIIIPEPGSAVLIACCGMVVMMRRRRRLA